MFIEKKQLKDFVLDSGLVSAADFAKAEKEAEGSGVPLGEELVREGKLSEDDLRRMQAYILGIPFVDLRNQKIDFEILSLIPEPIARKNNIVAFRKNDRGLEVAMLDTADLGAIDFVTKKVGLKILPRLTNTESVKHALLQYQKSLTAEFGDIIKKESSAITAIRESTSAVSESDLKKMAEEMPVVRIVDTLLKHAILQDASDIHIEQMETEVVVRYRIDGILHDTMVLPKHVGPSIVARIKVLSNLRLDEKRLPQDGRFKVETEGDKVSLRVSIMPTYFGEKIVMRLLKENSTGFTLEGLGFHGRALESIHACLKQTTGMLLSSGPTGSGKTTTLYTMLDILNTPRVNIATIEDPVEYQMKRVNQTQVKPEIGFTFASGLRSLVRQDPDIVMVGEIRDNETASLAVNASLTGHLVLSTLHTNSAAGAIPRLLDMKVEPFLLISTLNVVIGQRLVRKLSDKKEKYFMSRAEIDLLGKSIDLVRVLSSLKEEKMVAKDAEWEKLPFYRPLKSENTDASFHGRLVIHEVLRVSPTIKNLIIRGASSDELEAQAKKEGMMTMIEDGLFKAVQGITTVEEVLRVITE